MFGTVTKLSDFDPIPDRFRIGFFRAAHVLGGRIQKGPLHKIFNTYPTMMKLDTVIPYVKKIKKIYKSCDTLLEFC